MSSFRQRARRLMVGGTGGNGSTISAFSSTAAVVPVTDAFDHNVNVQLQASTYCGRRRRNRPDQWQRDGSNQPEHREDDDNTGNCFGPVEKIIATPVPPVTEPLLQLEGDQYHPSKNWIARSLYRIVSSSPSSSSLSLQGDMNVEGAGIHIPSICIEELYDLAGARKSFLVREEATHPTETSVSSAAGLVQLGASIPFRPSLSLLSTPLILSEINAADSAMAGTGSRTWDSSIVMSIYFSSRPELLYGDVIELGSGVGLGGILCYLFRTSSLQHPVPFYSMTLTDYQKQVLDKCSENVAKLACEPGPPLFGTNRHDPSVPVHVNRIDWHDFLRQTGSALSQKEKYDTILACDCAYLYPDIKALVSTMIALPRKRETSKIHAFGPINRGGLIQLIDELRGEPSIEVDVEVLDMERHRLETPSCLGEAGGTESEVDPLEIVLQRVATNETCTSFSTHDAKFLHVTCTLRSSPKKSNDHQSGDSLSEID